MAGLVIVETVAIAVVWALAYCGVVSDTKIITLIAIPALALVALYAWYIDEKAKKVNTEAWRAGLIGTLLLGAVSFAIDVFIGSTHGHYSNFVQTAFHAGGPAGIVVTVLICPIGTAVCAGSYVRGLLLDRFFPQFEVEG